MKDNEKGFNIYDVRITLDGKKWLIDGENGYNTYSKTLDRETVIELYRKGK